MCYIMMYTMTQCLFMCITLFTVNNSLLQCNVKNRFFNSKKNNPGLWVLSEVQDGNFQISHKLQICCHWIDPFEIKAKIYTSILDVVYFLSYGTKSIPKILKHIS